MALFTHTSIRPSSRSTLSAASTASASETSVGIASALPPASSTSRLAPSSPSRPRARRPTWAPSPAKARTVARPTPAEAPVTTTTRGPPSVPMGPSSIAPPSSFKVPVCRNRKTGRRGRVWVQIDPPGYLRACADRDEMTCMESGHRMLDHPGSSLSFATKEDARARAPTLPHRAHMATVFSAATGEGDEPSARVSPFPHPREGGLREAGASTGLRLRLPQDRRRRVPGHPRCASAATSGSSLG